MIRKVFAVAAALLFAICVSVVSEKCDAQTADYQIGRNNMTAIYAAQQ